MKWLINPFKYLAGFKALFFGIVTLLCLSLLTYSSGTHIRGISTSFAKDTTLIYYTSEVVLSWIIFSMFLYIAGLILSKSKIRFVDVFGTIALSKLPLIIVPLLRLTKLFQSMVLFSLTYFILITILLFITAWTIILYYNAFKVSCNLKGITLNTAFIIALIVSELVTNMIVFLLIY